MAEAAAIIKTVGSVVMAAVSYSSAMNRAKILENEATAARHRGQINQQERDFESAMLISEDTASQAGTGLELGSTSQKRRFKRFKVLARRDALRIRDDAEREAIQLENEAAAARAEGTMAALGGVFSAVGGAFDIKASMITESSLEKALYAASLRRQARSVRM